MMLFLCNELGEENKVNMVNGLKSGPEISFLRGRKCRHIQGDVNIGFLLLFTLLQFGTKSGAEWCSRVEGRWGGGWVYVKD